MKNIAVAAFLTLSLVACKKETPSKPEITTKTDSFSTEKGENQTIQNKELVSLKEVSSENMSQLLKPQTNDTMYVTNFFATWCGPCMNEIPHFKEKMIEMKGKPVKFTFVSLDNKTDWNTTVKDFADENELSKNIVLLDGANLKPEFFSTNFKQWKGETIPFTIMKKGTKVEEIEGSVSKEDLATKIASFQ